MLSNINAYYNPKQIPQPDKATKLSELLSNTSQRKWPSITINLIHPLI